MAGLCFLLYLVCVRAACHSALLALEEGEPSRSCTTPATPVSSTGAKSSDRKLFASELRRMQDVIQQLTTERSQLTGQIKRLGLQLEGAVEERDHVREEMRIAHDKWLDLRAQLQATVRELQASHLAFDGLQEQLEAARGAQDDVRALQEAFRALTDR